MHISNQASRNIVGIMLVALGVLFLLDTLDVFGDTSIAGDYWPMLIIAAGLVAWAQSGFRFVLPPVIVIAVGVLFLIQTLTDVDFGELWPVLLIIVGLWFVWLRSKPLRSGARGPVDGTGTVNTSAILGGNEHRVTGEFKGGRVVAFMGGGKLNLTEATLPAEGAVLDASAIMGGYEIHVPATWNVVLNVDALLGAAEDKRRGNGAPGEASPMLEVTGTAFMGGIEIK